MKEDRFIKQNAHIWAELEETLGRLKKKGFRKSGRKELDSLLDLYNLTCGHLSHCRTYYGNTDTAEYLNRLMAAAHSCIYTTGTSNFKNLGIFIIRGFPKAVRQNLLFLAAAMCLFFTGFLFSFLYTMQTPDNATAFMPQQYIDSMNFNGKSAMSWNSPVMSSVILSNNIMVSFRCFALGVTLGLGTVYSLVYNSTSTILGCMAALAHQQGYGMKFWSLILPHGVLELFAIFISGAAGLKIGYSIINPGKFSRKDSLILRGREAIRLVLGTIPLFIIAGFIEGFVTPSGLSETLKLLFALSMLVLLLAYLVIPNLAKRTVPVAK